MKTLLNIQYSSKAQQQFIDWANAICGYPDNISSTLAYANPSEPILLSDKQAWITEVTHDLQEKAIEANDNTYSFVSGEILEDGTIIVTDTTISNVETLDPLVKNVRNYSIEVERIILENAEMEVIETLLGDNNTLGNLL